MNLSLIEVKDVRKFGIIAFPFFGCLACLGYLKHRVLLAPVLSVLSVTGLGFIVMPSRLLPVYRLWVKTALLIGRIVTAIILALAYYLIITPSALMKRCFGGRPIPMKPDPDATSYWVPRSEPAQPKERFLKRY